MKTLEQQLADYGEHQKEFHGPISSQELVTRLGRTEDDVFVRVDSPSRRPATTRRRRSWPIAAATAVAVLVVVGGATWLAHVTGSDTAVSGTAEQEGLGRGSWARVAHDEAVFGGGGGLNSVTLGGPGLVAVGQKGIVLTSIDGITWSLVPFDEAVFDGAEINAVTAGGPGLVAVGETENTRDRSGDTPDAAVWTSVDGVAWSRVPHDEEVFGDAFMTSITAGGPGLVAVGQTDGVGTDGDAVVWTSVDGITWSRVRDDEEVFGGPQRQSMFDVVVGGPGLVAVGREGDERPWDNSFDNGAAVWTSEDGITWTRVPNDETVFGTAGNPATGSGPVMLSVTEGGPGLVAVGRKAVWTSPDGVTWTRILDDVPVRPIMTGVTARGSDLVAVGCCPSGATAAWTSVDGITWSQVPHDDAVFGSYPDWINDVTVGGPGLVAVGHADDDPAVWVWVSATQD